LYKYKKNEFEFSPYLSNRKAPSVVAYCNSVKCAWDAHFGRLAKTGPKGAGSHANRGEIGSADLCSCRFVKGKSIVQIVDEH